MFLLSINSNQQKLFWLGFHLLLGAVAAYTRIPLIAWFLVNLFIAVPLLFTTKDVSKYMQLVVYFVAFEVLGRMARTSPFIPYEVAKYLFFAFALLGIAKGYTKGIIGYLLFLLLVPGMIVNEAGELPLHEWIFNILGPINIALGVVVLKKQKVTLNGLMAILRACIYPIIAMVAFVIVKAPTYTELTFSLGSNTGTSGGFGANQVSTMFGLGAFITFIFIFLRITLTGKRWVDISLLVLFLFQGLLTFSRGGVIGAVLGIIIIFYYSLQTRQIKQYTKFIPAIILLGIVFVMADKLTGGVLLQRYQGESASTLAGAREKSLTVITSGRSDIFLGDLALFYEHPVFGVGVGSSRSLRAYHSDLSAHVELSRLLAEHGLMGIFYFLLMLAIGVQIMRVKGNPLLKSLKVAFFIIALYSTFHSATRTFVTPILMGLSVLSITNVRYVTRQDDEEDEITSSELSVQHS